MQLDDILQTLRNRGWSKTLLATKNRQDFEHLLIRMAASLGLPTPTRGGSGIIDELRPKEAETAHKKSLSILHGRGCFPLHTDTAHWPVPCRFIILACINSGKANRPTWLLDSHSLNATSLESERLRTTPFAFCNGRRSFISTIMSPNRGFIRFDPGCMVSKTPDGKKTMGILDTDRWSSDLAEIRWEAGEVLIIDNWRILHGRGAATGNDESRTLLRITIQ